MKDVIDSTDTQIQWEMLRVMLYYELTTEDYTVQVIHTYVEHKIKVQRHTYKCMLSTHEPFL